MTSDLTVSETTDSKTTVERRAPMVTNKKVKVYESLRQRIIDGELKPGLPINEAAFASELSVSKTPVREALRPPLPISTRFPLRPMLNG